MSIQFKRHYPLLVLFASVVLLSVLAFGDARIIAYTTGTSDVAQVAGVNYENSVDLFDDTAIHEIIILMNQADYDTMIETYVETGEKDFFSTDIIIDGVRINDVGIRLKGNSTLAGLSGRGEPGKGEPPIGAEGNQPPPPGFDGNRPPPPRFGGPPPPHSEGDMPSSLETREIPFLIKFDEYELGQRYQGYAEIALRVRGHLEEDAALLSELLTAYLYDSVDLPVAQMAYAGVSVNGEAANLYVIAEHVDELYIEKHFPASEGVLYKAQPRGNFRYHGQDPTAYATSFEQKTKVNDEDLAPLIDFIRFVNQATDEEFERGLAKYLDIDSFVTYLALNNLIVNMDSLGGNGNNYYLCYNLDSGQFTVLVWDMNESLGQFWFSRTSNYQLDPYYKSDHPWNHPLRARFLENARFRALYDKAYRNLMKRVYGRDLVSTRIEQLSALFGQENARQSLLDQTTYDKSVAYANEFLSQRKAFLLSLELPDLCE